VCPKSIVDQWYTEIKRFSYGSQRILRWDGPSRPTDYRLFDSYDIVIAPYSLMTDPSTPLHKIGWNRMVLDEAHDVRNERSKRTMSIRRIRSKITWLVTGTPVFNSVRDFGSLCAFLKISKQEVELHMPAITRRCVLRRTKADVNINVPACDFQNVELQMNEDEKKLYGFVYQDSKSTALKAMGQNKNNIIIECFLRVRQVLVWPQMYLDGVARREDKPREIFSGSTTKMDTLVGMIETHPTEKTLIFCVFRDEMAEIQRRLVHKRTYVISGSVPQDQRIRDLNSFRAHKGGAIYIIQIQAGGVGLNLQEATRVYITAPHWNPAMELQAIARAHRKGQTRQVIVRKLVYMSEPELPSIEQSIMTLQNHKSIVCAQVLNDPRLEEQLPKIQSKVVAPELRKLFV